MLITQPIAANVDHSHHWNLELPPTRRHTGHEPVDYAVVRALVDKLVYHAVLADCARNHNKLGIGWIASISPAVSKYSPENEVVPVKRCESLTSNTTGHGRNMVDVWLGLCVRQRLGLSHSPP